MNDLYTVRGSRCFGAYFYRPKLNNILEFEVPITIVQTVKIPNLQVGEMLHINGQTTISCLKNMAVSYSGFHDNMFTAAELYLYRADPPGSWLDYGFADVITLNGQHGNDIHDGSKWQPMQPYKHHNEIGMHKIQPGQEGDWWATFCAWPSSSGAIKADSRKTNEYVWIIPQQTSLQVMRIGP